MRFAPRSQQPIFEPALEAAPARNGVRFLALAIFVLLLCLAGRAVQLAFSGDPTARPHTDVSHPALERADLVDRNGVLLATTVRAFVLTATIKDVWNPQETAERLRAVFPDLDVAATVRRLNDHTRRVVYVQRGLTPGQREQVEALGLAGLGFETEDRRIYPNNELGADALGFTDRDLKALAGVERGLDQQIRAAGRAGHAVRLSLDVRAQHALDVELAAAATQFHATGGAAILLDGRTGETLALGSWPSFDPNEPGAASDDARRDRVGGDVYELGSTLKPFTIAMALDQHLTTPAERFHLTAQWQLDGTTITDHDLMPADAGLRDIIARSSNVGAAQLALRVGARRQRTYLDHLGLLAPSPLELGRRREPIAPAPGSRRDVAGLGFGYGLAATPAALAGAYTVFVNGGARVPPTLLARQPGDSIPRTAVFSTDTTRTLLTYLRATVTEGTGRAADVPGLEMAGKTGTAEKLNDAGAGYDESRNFSSFAGVFPASNPRYVIVVALDDVGAGGMGAQVAAPAVARIVTRIAPILGLRVEPRTESAAR